MVHKPSAAVVFSFPFPYYWPHAFPILYVVLPAFFNMSKVERLLKMRENSYLPKVDLITVTHRNSMFSLTVLSDVLCFHLNPRISE